MNAKYVYFNSKQIPNIYEERKINLHRETRVYATAHRFALYPALAVCVTLPFYARVLPAECSRGTAPFRRFVCRAHVEYYISHVPRQSR